MTLEYYSEFVVLAETQNYHRAADKLFISQSTLSKHIKALEEELQVPLFDRSTKGVQLNELGRLLLPYAQQIDHAQKSAKMAIRNQLGSMAGTVHIVTAYRIFDEILEFKKRHPDMHIFCNEWDSVSHIKHALRTGACEIAILPEDDETQAEFNAMPYAEDRMVLLLPKVHRLASRRQIPVYELAKESLIMCSPENWESDMVFNTCMNAGFTPTIAGTGFYAGERIEMVRAGLGAAFMPARTAEALLQGNDVTVCEPFPAMPVSFCLYSRKNAIFSPAAAVLIDDLLLRQKKSL